MNRNQPTKVGAESDAAAPALGFPDEADLPRNLSRIPQDERVQVHPISAEEVRQKGANVIGILLAAPISILVVGLLVGTLYFIDQLESPAARVEASVDLLKMAMLLLGGSVVGWILKQFFGPRHQ